VVDERDELGSDLVPDYLTSVRDGAVYGWPWSYYGDTVDTRVEPARPDMIARAIAPDYALGSHVAPLGLAFSDGARLGHLFASGAFIGEHGSWNRDPFSGYKVVFVPFANGRPVCQPIDVLTGFLAGDKAFGRPVGVEIARDGALLVADDVGNAVWRSARGRQAEPRIRRPVPTGVQIGEIQCPQHPRRNRRRPARRFPPSAAKPPRASSRVRRAAWPNR